MDTNSSVAPQGSLRYDCINRLIYGTSGQWLHVGVDCERATISFESTSEGYNAMNYVDQAMSNSMDQQSKSMKVSGFHIYCPRHLSARRICSTIKDITAGWKDHALTTLGYPHSYDYIPPNRSFIEVDIPMKYALAGMIKNNKNNHSSGGQHSNKSSNSERSNQDEDGGQEGLDSAANMSPRDVDKVAKEALLCTFVKQSDSTGQVIAGQNFDDKVLILTKRHVILCDYNPGNWQFPVNWGEIQVRESFFFFILIFLSSHLLFFLFLLVSSCFFLFLLVSSCFFLFFR